jgi:pilus assembly protein CpaE
MTLVLVIDDEPVNHQLVARALESLEYTVHSADNGTEGIYLAHKLTPDLIITDVMMPDMNGYELTRTLRREPQFAATPILVLTAQSGLEAKIQSFEAGADDHLTKPFEPQELAVRVTALLRRAEAVQKPGPVATKEKEKVEKPEGLMIAVHSLRGGTGCSSLAVNLGVGLSSLWHKPTILLDLTMTAGQVALMLNMTLRRTWANIAGWKPEELEMDSLASLISAHESGLHFIAAPTFPSEAETIRSETMEKALKLIKGVYDYVVADLPHDFSGHAIQALDLTDVILMVTSPDMASIRSVAAAMDTYGKLGYPREKMKLILSAPFPHSNLTKEKIETALGITATATIPYTQNVFVDAINFGQPLVFQKPVKPVSGILEDFAFYMSKDDHKKVKPENPTEAWNRVYKRYHERKK